MADNSLYEGTKTKTLFILPNLQCQMQRQATLIKTKASWLLRREWASKLVHSWTDADSLKVGSALFSLI